MAAVLGVAGAWADDEGMHDNHYVTKAGGYPNWPPNFSHGGPPRELLVCDVCGCTLLLVVQAYAPLYLATQSIAERTIYVFACTQKDCGREKGSWKVFRLQMHPNVEDSSLSHPIASQVEEPPVRVGSAEGNHVHVDKESSLEEPSHTLGNLPPGIPPGTTSAATTAEQDASIAGPEAVKALGDGGSHGIDRLDLPPGCQEAVGMGGSKLCVDEFPVEAMEDWEPDGGASWEAGNSLEGGLDAMEELREALLSAGMAAAASGTVPAVGAGRGRGEEAVVKAEVPGKMKSGGNEVKGQRALPCFYIVAEEERLKASAATAAGGGGTAEPSTHTPAPPSGDGGGQGGVGGTWEGEEYERDSSLHAGPAFLKFKKRIDRSPQQCIRYCFAGAPLLPSAEHPSVRPCDRCQRPAIFEMQLMPPLLFFLTEACGGQAGPTWDWMTALLYSCPESCFSMNLSAGEWEFQDVTECFLLVGEP